MTYRPRLLLQRTWLVCLAVVALLRPGATVAETAIAGSISKVSDFALLDHRGAFQHLYYYAKDPATKAIVLFVQGNGCPLSRARIPELKRLRDAYATNG